MIMYHDQAYTCKFICVCVYNIFTNKVRTDIMKSSQWMQKRSLDRVQQTHDKSPRDIKSRRNIPHNTKEPIEQASNEYHVKRSRAKSMLPLFPYTIKCSKS